MISNTKVAAEIAGHLLDIEAVKLSVNQPFTWASGWKSPIYCDNRKTLSYPDIRSVIRDSFAALVTKHFADAELIAGVATAGIPHATLVADKLGLPMCYIRSEGKGHGLQNRIEGILKPGQRVVVVEDLVSTGMSSLSAIEAITQAGAVPIGMVAIFSYGFPIAAERFNAANIPVYTLSDYESLIELALKRSYISIQQKKQLVTWKSNPEKWMQTV